MFISEACIGCFQRLYQENEQLLKRVAEAMKTGHYPRASDAKLVDDQLHKTHLSKRRKKLEVRIVTVMLFVRAARGL